MNRIETLKKNVTTICGDFETCSAFIRPALAEIRKLETPERYHGFLNELGMIAKRRMSKPAHTVFYPFKMTREELIEYYGFTGEEIYGDREN